MEASVFYKLPMQDIYKKLESNKTGLSTAEAKNRLLKNGVNKIESFKSKTPLSIFVSQFSSFLVWLLIIADAGSGLLWMQTGRQEFLLNLGVITFIIIANALLGFFQEFQAQRHADNLRKMLEVKAKVIRNSQEQDTGAEDLVVGDIIVLTEGDKIPADAILIEAENLYVDESSLTGESTPVEKHTGQVQEDKPLGERYNSVFAQSFIVKGQCKAIVVTTGMETEVGKIFLSINKTKEEKTSFEKEINVVGKKIAIVIGILIICTGVFLIYHKMPLSTVFIISVSLAVGAIPEGLPAITTFVLALGSQRMLKQKFLVKKLSSIESLGSVDVIATDKTGTLTQNKMRTERIYVGNHDIDLSKTKLIPGILGHKNLDIFLHSLVFANEVEIEKGDKLSGDPTETALIELAEINGLNPIRLRSQTNRLDLIPFSSDTLFTATLYKNSSLELFKTGKNKIFVSGAPETVLGKCDLDKTSKEEILKKTEEFSQNALRILAIAVKDSVANIITDTGNLTFLGLIGLKDPPRPEIKNAIAEAQSAGIKILMLTGDYKLTAQAIAREIGMNDIAVDVTEIKNLSDEEFSKLVEEVDIFSRMDPDFKLKILSTLQKNGHRVAMTGDGVNDAPALKKADMSIAMGIRGTDLAKEVSHVILLDDNFATIINGIKEGRTIFHNVRKFVNYILTANVAEVMVVLVTSIFGFIPLTATQILWTNFITDVFPAMALGVDPSPKNIMEQNPKGAKEQVLNNRVVGLTFAIGIKKTLIMLLTFAIGLKFWNLGVAQTMTFSWLVFSHFIRILSIRVDEGINFFVNKYVNMAILISSVLQLVILYSPIRVFFNAVSLSITEFIIVLIFLFALGTPASILLTQLIDRVFPNQD